jgi:hypothetical protein
VTQEGESVAVGSGSREKIGEVRFSSANESEIEGELKAVAGRKARVTFTTQSAVSFAGNEKFWPTLYMSTDVSSTKTSCGGSVAFDPELMSLEFERDTRYAGLNIPLGTNPGP